MSEITAELAERMATHLRECASVHGIRPRDPDSQRRYDEMKAIVAELPAPVDPDLLEARKHFLAKQPHDERAIMAGERDHSGSVRSFMEGIKRGRALATPATSA